MKVGNESLEMESTVLPFLSDSEVKRLRRISNPRRRREYLLSRAVLRQALTQIFALPLNDWEITERDNALPSITNLPSPVFYSLSHSDSEINFVLADRAIGIDLEVIKPRKNLCELAQQFMHPDELTSLGTPADVWFFYRTWSAKEAYFKALSSEEQVSTVLSDVLIWTVLHKDTWQQTDLTDEQFSRIVVVQS